MLLDVLPVWLGWGILRSGSPYAGARVIVYVELYPYIYVINKYILSAI